MSTEILDLFCEWFEGRFDNWTQASSNPTKCGSNVSQISYLPNNELFFKINEVS